MPAPGQPVELGDHGAHDPASAAGRPLEKVHRPDEGLEVGYVAWGRYGLVDALSAEEVAGVVVEPLHPALFQEEVLGLVLDDALLLGVDAAVGFAAPDQPFDCVGPHQGVPQHGQARVPRGGWGALLRPVLEAYGVRRLVQPGQCLLILPDADDVGEQFHLGSDAVLHFHVLARTGPLRKRLSWSVFKPGAHVRRTGSAVRILRLKGVGTLSLRGIVLKGGNGTVFPVL